ncbi:MAG: hypothetical protein ACFFCE_10795 [Promethearchaeota archaeon]
MSYFVDGYYTISFFFFILYFVVISIFGYSIFSILNKEGVKKNFTISSILKYFTLGLITHLVYSMIIVSFQIFNFFSVYLPFIICDVCFLTFSVKKNFKLKIQDFDWRKVSFLFKRNITSFLILIIIFFMQYTLMMFFIWNRLAFPSSDPYAWFRNVWFVHNNGAINYNSIEGYPPGYILFGASMISLTNDYYTIYFFCKYLPIFLSSINLLVLFAISKNLFKKKIYVFFTLSMYLSVNYLFYRYEMFIPSTLATTLGFLFLLFLRDGSIVQRVLNDLSPSKNSVNTLKKSEFLFRGAIISGIIMIHALYGLFYLCFYLLYEFYLFIVLLKSNRKILNSKSFFTIKFLKYFSSFFLIIVFMLLPWYIGTSIYLDYPLYQAFTYYISSLNSFQSPSFINKLGRFFYELASFIFDNTAYRDLDNFFHNDIMYFFNFQNSLHFYINTIGTGIILIVIGIFLPFKKFFNLDEKQKNLVRFVKFTFILSLLLYLINDLINFKKIPFTSRLNYFLSVYLRRVFELFAGYWVILFVLAFNFIILYFSRLFLKTKYIRKITKNDSIDKFFSISFLKKNFKKVKFTSKILKNNSVARTLNFKLIKRSLNRLKSIKKISKKKFIRKILGIPVIIVGIFISGFYYTINYRRIYYLNHFSDDYAKAVLFAGNYFNKNPLEEETTIVVELVESKKFIYKLLVSDNLNKRYYTFYDYNETHFLNYTDYIEFKEYIELMNASYVLLNVVFTDVDFQSNLYSDINLLYRNRGFWIFGEIL